MHIAIHEALDGKPLYPAAIDFNIDSTSAITVLGWLRSTSLIAICQHDDVMGAETYSYDDAIDAITEAVEAPEPPYANDENGYDARYQDWLWACRKENQAGICSDGDRVTSAKALQIAADVLHYHLTGANHNWTGRDIQLALGAIAGIRSQQGCEDYDPAIRDGYLTHLMDIVIYG